MRAVDRPSAVKMIALLDPAFPLGIDPASKGVSSAKDGLYAHYKQVRGACPGGVCTPDIAGRHIRRTYQADIAGRHIRKT